MLRSNSVPCLPAGHLLRHRGGGGIASRKVQFRSWPPAASSSVRAKEAARAGRARNVILFVGDGMGIATITAARILEGQQRGETGEENRLSFEEFPATALVRTYSANQQTSDSAPTATAMVTGWHANDGALSVGPAMAENEASAEAVAKHSLETLLELAEQRGRATGIVTTTRITHATPGFDLRAYA